MKWARIVVAILLAVIAAGLLIAEARAAGQVLDGSHVDTIMQIASRHLVE